jgi:C-terminal processing protease CtpA/Prc
MLLGTMIDNLVVGGPAYNSRQLHHGDVIVKVDGVPVTQSNITEMMVGNDTPGSPVIVSIARGGPKVSAARRSAIAIPPANEPAGRAPSSTCG